MELTDYLNPVNKTDISFNKSEPECLGNQLKSFKNNENQNNIHVALIGIDCTSNSIAANHEFSANLVRGFLYSLAGLKNLNIVDLGNLKTGKSLADNYSAVKDLTTFLVQKDIIPFFLGGSQEFSVPIAESIKENLNKLEVTFIDSLVDFIDEPDFHSRSYLNQNIFLSDASIIRSIVGFQSYFTPNPTITKLTDKGFNFYRLGTIRNKFVAIEPIFRDTNFCSFDMSSVRQSDAPFASFQSPNGLYAEEACQLANLAGKSDNLKAIYLGEINISLDQSSQTKHLMAQIAWHFLQGLSMREGDYPIKDLKDYKKIFVTNSKSGFELLFYQNKNNNRYWVELPGNNSEVIACSEYDYKAVCFNEIPERIWKRISNTIK